MHYPAIDIEDYISVLDTELVDPLKILIHMLPLIYLSPEKTTDPPRGLLFLSFL